MVENVFKENKEQWKHYWLDDSSGCVCCSIWKLYRKWSTEDSSVYKGADYAIFACWPNTYIY